MSNKGDDDDVCVYIAHIYAFCRLTHGKFLQTVTQFFSLKSKRLLRKHNGLF